MHEMRKLFKMCLGLYVSALLFGTEDTSECTFKNISSSREACNLEDVLYDWWPFPVLSKKCPCILTDCLLWTAGRAEPIQAEFITISCEGWPCEQRSACMFSEVVLLSCDWSLRGMCVPGWMFSKPHSHFRLLSRETRPRLRWFVALMEVPFPQFLWCLPPQNYFLQKRTNI